jgi:hypothetical protein
MTAGGAAYYRTATGKKARVAAVIAAATGTASGMSRAVGMLWETKTSGATRTTVKVKLVGGPMAWA